jgi:hypothetical protein
MNARKLGLNAAILPMNRGGDGSSPCLAYPSFRLGTSRPHPGSWAQCAYKIRGSLIMDEMGTPGEGT